MGGLLTGNNAHGGLSASAGTPHGQQAGAGIGGLLGGNGHGVGASAAIGGGLDDRGAAGGAGAESHAGGVSKKVVRLGQTNQGAPPSEVVITKETGLQHGGNFERIDDQHQVHTELRAPAPQPAPAHSYHKTVYKKKVISHPHKVAIVETQHTGPEPQIDLERFFDFQKFSNFGAHYAHPAPPPPPPPPPPPTFQKTFVKQVSYQQAPSYEKEVHTRFDSSNGHSGSGASSSSTHVVSSSSNAHNPNFWNDIFNIPISTLTAVNQLLNNKSQGGAVHVEKRVEHHH
uniref:Uncharacterized protein n=1 Tax=Anopheles maculatus TaxID=74869 RepID=A0A182TB46_9DIPT